MPDFEKAFLLTVAFEGGDSNDPDDRGGRTRYGISQRAYPDLDISKLTLEDAKALYRRDCWDKCGCDRMNDQRHAEIVFDIAVNMGVSAAKELLMETLKIDAFAMAMAVKRIKRYVRICQAKPSQKKFLLGWICRALNAAGVK